VDVVPGDAELVAAARSGDAASFGALLERHRAGMRAVALSLLGWGPDAEDVVQDAMLVALQRLGGLRDPAAVGPWLKAITRNAARMRLRSANDETPLGEQAQDVVSRAPTPQEILDDHALRDWVWSALETLSEPLQVAVLLRYFTQVGSYGQIARRATCRSAPSAVGCTRPAAGSPTPCWNPRPPPTLTPQRWWLGAAVRRTI